MDFLNRKFIAALDSLREELASLQKSIDSIRDEYKTQQHDRNQLPPSVIVQAELQVPEAIERDHGRRDDRTHRQQIWLTVGTWLAFGAAAIYATIAGWQTSVLRSNFRMEQRAFMKITAEAGQSLDIIPPAFWTARFTNAGKTPAFQIEGKFQFQFLKKNESPVFDYETRPYSSFDSPLMWPDDKDATAVIRAYYRAGTHTREDVGISPEELALLKNGEAWIAKNGRVTYEDIFGVMHVTSFCAASTVTTMDVRKRQEFPGMHICIAYNSVDTN